MPAYLGTRTTTSLRQPHVGEPQKRPMSSRTSHTFLLRLPHAIAKHGYQAPKAGQGHRVRVHSADCTGACAHPDD